MAKPKDKYNQLISVRFTEPEHKTLLNNCEALGLSKSDYIRASTLAKRIKVRKAAMLDSKSIAELSRLGGLLKHLHKSSDGTTSHETWEILCSIKSLIAELHESLNDR